MSKTKIDSKLRIWASEVRKINGDPEKAKKFIQKYYYTSRDEFKALFKPTLTEPIVSIHGVIEYFMYFTSANKINHIEWNTVKEEESSKSFMGTYTFFTEAGFVTAHYSFVFNSDDKIVLHHSSLPLD